MEMELTALHWIYVVFIALIIGFMVKRRDTTLICIVGIFLLALVATGSLASSISGIFNSFIFAITELMSTILIISIIVAMSTVLTKSGINDVMIAPFAKFIKNPTLAFWVIGIVMMMISWFFWPSPAVALLGAVLLPVALRAGLPALGVLSAIKGVLIIVNNLIDSNQWMRKQKLIRAQPNTKTEKGLKRMNVSQNAH